MTHLRIPVIAWDLVKHTLGLRKCLLLVPFPPRIIFQPHIHFILRKSQWHSLVVYVGEAGVVGEKHFGRPEMA